MCFEGNRRRESPVADLESVTLVKDSHKIDSLFL